MAAWARRVAPRTFSIVGGEPTLNRALPQIVQAAGEIWSGSRIRLVTNGLQLSRHPELPRVLAAIGERSHLEITSHHPSPEFQARFAPVWKIAAEWKDEYGIQIRFVDAASRWTRRYHYADRAIQFMDGDPRLAWEACEGKKAPQIFEGNLWKCPPVAYFGLMSKMTSVDSQYLEMLSRYRSLDPVSTDHELAEFLGREDEAVCRICPSELDHFALLNPLYQIT